ncbi:MAG: glyoxalase superfamily protein [Pseudomonadota bacterium]
MTVDNIYPPSTNIMKKYARRLRARLKRHGTEISHSQSLEMIAHQHGFRDWNHASAVAQKPALPSLLPGARVTGLYLGQGFRGEIVAAQPVARAHTRITVLFDQAVDVVTFESFSAYRSRVSAVVNKFGASEAKTSNGEPHMIVTTA